MTNWFKSHNRTVLLFGFITIAALLRFPQIYADPPAGDISRSGVFLADEGIYGYNSIQWLVTGKWYTPDAFNAGVNSPTFMVFEYLWMKIFGISLASVRYGGIFCGLLTLVLLYFVLSQFNKTAGLIAVLLGAVNFPLIIYNRLALNVNLLLVLLLSLVLIFLAILNNPRRIKLVFAFWIIFFLAYLTKSLILFFILPCLVMASQIDAENRKRILMFSAFNIVILCVILWLYWVSQYWEDWRYFQQLNIGSKLSFNPKDIIKNYARYLIHIKFFEFMPVLFTIALLEVFRGISDIVKKREISQIRYLLICWLVSGWLLLGFFAYSPPRYSLILLPAILGLNGLFFSEILSKQKNSTGYSSLSLILIGIICLLQVGFGVYRIIVYKGIYPSCFFPVLGLLIIGGFWLASQRHILNRNFGLVFLGFFLLLQGFQITRYYLNQEFSLHSAIQDVAHTLRQNDLEKSVLAGDIATLVAYEIKHPIIDSAYRRDKLPQLVNRMQPKYLFLESPEELSRLQEEVPNLWTNPTVLKRYRILNNYRQGQDAVLYRLNH